MGVHVRGGIVCKKSVIDMRAGVDEFFSPCYLLKCGDSKNVSLTSHNCSSQEVKTLQKRTYKITQKQWKVASNT